jgi:hypothetical protein
MHGARGWDDASVTGKDETALKGGFASRGHQRCPMVRSDWWAGRAHPYLPRWTHACMGPAGAVVIDLGEGPMGEGNPCGRGRAGRQARHKDVL